MTITTWDTVIVGGGASGLSAAQALGRSLRRTLVLDSGTPRNRFADHMHNVLGNDGLPPGELLTRGRAEALGYGVEFRDARVVSVVDAGTVLHLELARGDRLVTRSLVVASGVTDELAPIPGLAEHWGNGVLHCPYCHGWEVRGSRIGFIPNAATGMHLARLLRQWTDELTVFTHGLGRLAEEDAVALRSRGIALVGSPVVEVFGSDGDITGVRTEDGEEFPIDAVFTTSSATPRDGFLADLDLARTETPFGPFLAVDPMQRTSHPRIWAIGNIVAPAATVPMAMGAGTQAAAAVNYALVEEDFALAAASAGEQAPTTRHAGSGSSTGTAGQENR